ncbi:flavodoxin [Caenimonas terrae]|uniref:Flavodoxin n=1 Tax=Caenimonas terrae TaxID=696074 RepID=A0ABW0NFQ2_9BURK
MDSTLVVCYSYTGISRRAARLLCSHRGWALGEIAESGPRGTLRCVLDSLLRRQPAIHYNGPDPGSFRTVVLIAPIWMYRLAGPMRSFVAIHRERLQRVAVIATMNAAGASNAFAEIARLLGRPPVRCIALLARSIEDGSGTGELLDFGAALEPASMPPQPAGDAAQAQPARQA